MKKLIVNGKVYSCNSCDLKSSCRNFYTGKKNLCNSYKRTTIEVINIEL